jgi:hypothetical protein
MSGSETRAVDPDSLNADPDPDPAFQVIQDPDSGSGYGSGHNPNPGFCRPKTEKLFDQKLQFTYAQATGEDFSPQ